MKLIDLHAKFVRAESDGVFSEYPETAARANSIMFDCPCGCPVRKYIGFEPPGPNTPPSRQGLCWTRTGETLETLTLKPSILFYATPSGPCKGWHGFVTDGEVSTC